MALPENFSCPPGEELHRYFRNVCIEFKKIVKESGRDIDALQMAMERFMGTSKQMNWQHKTGSVYHKDEAEKIAGRVWVEFKRYLIALQTKTEQVNPQDLLEAISAVERMIEEFKVS